LIDREQPGAYSEFVVSGPHAQGEQADIDIEVLTGLPEAPAGELMFECGTTWWANSDGLGYRVTWGTGRGHAIRLVARSNSDTTKVSAHVVQESWARLLGASGSDWQQRIPDPVRSPLDRILLMNHLATRGGIIVHSAGLMLDGAGYVFPGVSGAGKTTLCGLLTDGGLGDGLLSDDRTILRTDAGGGFRVWGTPWPGDAGIARNASAPLRALCFLVQDDAPALVPLSPAAAAKRLFAVASCPWYMREGISGVLDTVDQLVSTVPSVEFHFPRDAGAVGLLRGYATELDSASPHALG
jgi:hypothetical protein